LTSAYCWQSGCGNTEADSSGFGYFAQMLALHFCLGAAMGRGSGSYSWGS